MNCETLSVSECEIIKIGMDCAILKMIDKDGNYYQ